MTGSGGANSAEQHLGDHLAALVDGELGHDLRERVLAHLATCGRCKAEADEQRRLKNVFARTAPPPPSEGLLARLQGLPGGDDGSRNGPDDPFGGSAARGFGSRGFGENALGRRPGSPGGPPGDHAAAVAVSAVGGARQRGFRIHEIERPAVPQHATALRPGNAQRGRRFAFAAAGAVSLAAFALGGALPLEAALERPSGRTEGTGGADGPLHATPAANSQVLTGPVGDGRFAGIGGGAGVGSPAAPTETSHPQPLGLFAPLRPTDAVLSPLIQGMTAAQRAGTHAGPSPTPGPPSPAPTVLTAPVAPASSPAPGNGASPLVGGSAPPAGR